MFLQLPAGRAERADVQRHLRLLRGAAALLQSARCAGGDDVLPGRAATLGAGYDMVEGQVAPAAAILAGELVAQEQVEPGEGRKGARPDIGFERDDGGQLQ